MKNILIKNFVYLFLFLSVILFLYVVYRAEFVWEGNKFNYYKKYYLISVSSFIFFLLLLFVNDNIKSKSLLVITSLIFSLYLLEISLHLHSFISIKIDQRNKMKQLEKNIKLYELKYNKKYDLRKGHEVLRDELEKNKNTVTNQIPADYLSDNKLDIFPLMSHPNKRTIIGNENGYTAIILSDRYGFNNPDQEWDKKKIKYMLIGDSFTYGYAVNRPYDIGSNLRKKIKDEEGVLNLGFAGNGPLIELGILKEFLPLINTENVVWIYFEGNDLNDLINEKKNEILNNYVDIKNYSQNIPNKKNIIENLLEKKIVEKKNYKKKVERSKLISFLILAKTRKISLEKVFEDKVDDGTLDYFEKILLTAKNFAEEKNSNFFFVYLTDPIRYIDNLTSEKLYNYNKVMKILKKLDIKTIELDKKLFKKISDPLDLLPFRQYNHFNELGYEMIANTIANNIK